MRDLWIRLYIHALLRALHVFPGVELGAESPEYEPFGFVDVWRGNYHGNPVCIKAIRTRNSANLRKIKMVHTFLTRLIIVSNLTFMPDLLPRSWGVQAFLSSEHTSCCSDFGVALPILHHESLDVRR